MKLKFSKTLAIACILCMTFATLTAFAADNKVETITNYDFSDANQTELTIETTVYEVEEGDEITYYVSNNSKIVYIDQATAAGNTVNFTFTAAKGDLFDVSTLAKNGSDQGYTFPQFKFTEYCNFMTEGTPTIAEAPGNWGVPNSTYGDGTGYIYQGKVSGTVTAYGITVDGVEYPAHGCDEEGNFVIVLEGIDAEEFAKLSVSQFVR